MDPARDHAKQPNEPTFSKRMENAPVIGEHGKKNRDEQGTNYLKWGGIATIGIIALVTIIILGGRAITGYNTYSDLVASGVPEQYASDMTALAAAKAAAEQDAENARAEAQAARAEADAELAKIAQERESHAATKAAYQADLERLKEKSNALEEEVSTLEPAFKDAARKLCCIQRALDPAITGYDITDENTVACVKDNSGTSISC